LKVCYSILYSFKIAVDTFPEPQFSEALQGCQVQENYTDFLSLELLYLELKRNLKKPNFQVEKQKKVKFFLKTLSNKV
jgi:hypothetical protein